MKSLQNYIEDYQEQYITEMATIAKSVKLGKDSYRIAIHGASSKDREYPHIHIYLANDISLQKFNFEISLVDILCNDEINLVAQIDKDKGINRKHRDKCSWEGYRKLYDDFEDWLYDSPTGLPGEWIDNLDAIIWYCNHESPGDDYVRKYIEQRGKNILAKYNKYFR